MEKNFIILNVDNNKYWTGRYWDIPYSNSIKDAKRFFTEDELFKEITTTEEENDNIFFLLNEVEIFDVRIIYVKES